MTALILSSAGGPLATRRIYKMSFIPCGTNIFHFQVTETDLSTDMDRSMF